MPIFRQRFFEDFSTEIFEDINYYNRVFDVNNNVKIRRRVLRDFSTQKFRQGILRDC